MCVADGQRARCTCTISTESQTQHCCNIFGECCNYKDTFIHIAITLWLHQIRHVWNFGVCFSRFVLLFYRSHENEIHTQYTFITHAHRMSVSVRAMCQFVVMLYAGVVVVMCALERESVCLRLRERFRTDREANPKREMCTVCEQNNWENLNIHETVLVEANIEQGKRVMDDVRSPSKYEMPVHIYIY